jgi:hypothetical protein
VGNYSGNTMVMIEYIKDKWLTWKTGRNKSEREWYAWYDITVNYRANDIKDMFKNFEHIIEVSPEKFLDYAEPFAWVPESDAAQYFWPQRTVETTCVWRFERVSWNKWDRRWRMDELGGEDRVFVATNNSRDAMMITLRWA